MARRKGRDVDGQRARFLREPKKRKERDAARKEKLTSEVNPNALEQRFAEQFMATRAGKRVRIDHLADSDRAAMVGELYMWIGESRRLLSDLSQEAEALRYAEADGTIARSRNQGIARAIIWARDAIAHELTRTAKLQNGKGSEALVSSAPPWRAWDRLVGKERRWLLLPDADPGREALRREQLARCIPPIARWRARWDVRHAALEFQGWARNGESWREHSVASACFNAYETLHGVLDWTSNDARRTEESCEQRVATCLSRDLPRTHTGEIHVHVLRALLAEVLEVGQATIRDALAPDE